MTARLWTTATVLVASLPLLACSSGSSDSSGIALLADRDGDGLPDRLERALGSDPDDHDSPYLDGHLDFHTPQGPGPDAIPDGLERYLLDHGATPPITALSDRDGDQIPDYLEVRSGSDFANRDDPVQGGAQDLENLTGPSLDGVSDGLESFLLRLGARAPLRADTDTDDDGLSDVLEVRSGSNPFDPVDPPYGRAFDLDLDGLPDWLEIAQGSDFLNADFPTFDGASDDDPSSGPDGDAITDGLEGYLVRRGAVAPVTTLTDSDGDGATDFVEIAGGHDPFDATDPLPGGAVDSDSDGIPDSVEAIFARKLGRSISRTSDLDRDGITDIAELLAGSRPGDADSPTLFSHFDIDGDGIPDFLEIERGSDPGDPDSPTPMGGLDVSDASGPPSDPISDALEVLLVQLGASAPVTTYTDTDGDGLPDFVELRLVSNHLDANSPLRSGGLDVDDSTGPAGDGISDAAELVLIRLGASAPVGVARNSDGDVIPDWVELITGTNPADRRSPRPNHSADIDQDGAPDYLEIAQGSDFRSVDDPVAAGGSDSDGDGLSDALEALLLAAGSTAPVAPLTDTDADGLFDYLEIRLASDPYDGDHPILDGGNDIENRNGPAGDGISDAFEFYLIESGSPRPALRRNDADHDLVPDYVEARLAYDAFDGNDPLTDGGMDSDGDGVSNAFELVLAQLGSDVPVDGRTDTDGDGAPDHLEVFAGTNPYSANEPILGGLRDVDADGIPDALELVLFFLGASNPVTPQSDTDRDGIPDGFEVASGTNPILPDHPLLDGRLDIIDATGPADTITDGLEYLLIQLGASAPVSRASDTDGDGAPDHLEAFASASPADADDPVPGGSVDSDGDGLSQALEEVLIRWGAQAPVGRGTDTDRDGAPDFLEVDVGAHPTNASIPVANGATTGFDSNSATGPAGDGISDALERILIDLGCSAPITSYGDTDLDGLPDYFEGRFGTNPIDPDSPVASGGTDSNDGTGPAGDGLSDGLEAFLIAGGATGPITLTTDTDSDGVPDFYEVFKGSNPFDPGDFIAPGTKPSAVSLSITGTLFTGRTVFGNYVFVDAEGDPQGVSTFRWLRNGVAIAGETGTSYVIREVDLGTNLTFEVTPVARFSFPPSTAVGNPASRVQGVPLPQFPSGSGGPGGIDLGDGSFKFWFRSDRNLTLNGTLIEDWTDISGANLLADAPNAGRRPAFVASSGPNGRPALNFASDVLEVDLSALTSPPFTNNMTLVTSFLTTDTSNEASNRSLLSTSSSCTDDFVLGLKRFKPEFVVGGIAATGTRLLNDGEPHHIIATRVQTPGRTRTFVDGLQDGSTIAGTNPICGNTLFIGSTTRNQTFFIGDLFEVMGFSRLLPSSERILIEHYLRARYGGTLTQERYGFFDTHPDDLTGVGRITSTDLVESAEGLGIVRISNLDALDDGDFLIWGIPDARDFSLSTNVPAPFPRRLNRIWAYTISEETPSNGVGTATLRFRVGGLFLRPQASAFALLLDTDEDFSDASVHTLGRTYDAVLGTVSFTDVDLSGFDHFTLAVTPQ